MPAKMGGFRSPNGVRKPMIKSPGMMGEKPGMATMPQIPGGMPGMKKGGIVKKKKTKKN